MSRTSYSWAPSEPRKGLDVLLEAFAEVARDDRDVELWLAGQAGLGRRGPFGSATRRSIPSKGASVVLVSSTTTPLPALYRRARVVAYPSRGEGFGLPVARSDGLWRVRW